MEHLKRKKHLFDFMRRFMAHSIPSIERKGVERRKVESRTFKTYI